MRLLLAGDTHGDLAHLNMLLAMAQKHECDAVVQLGDFGYWEHHGDGVTTLDKLSQWFTKADIPLYWLDGNHENHTLLRRKYQTEEATGPVEIRDHVLYLRRGLRWVWDDVRFLAIGGAYSIDKQWRVEEMNKRLLNKARYYQDEDSDLEALKERFALWWPEEMITDTEVERAIEGGEVDVVFSHDAPAFIDLNTYFAQRGEHFFKDEENTLRNRQQLTRVFDAVRPRFWYHGHYHIPYTERIDLCTFRGLSANIAFYRSYQKAHSFTVVDTEDLQ